MAESSELPNSGSDDHGVVPGCLHHSFIVGSLKQAATPGSLRGWLPDMMGSEGERSQASALRAALGRPAGINLPERRSWPYQPDALAMVTVSPCHTMRKTLAGASGWYGQADPRWRVGLVGLVWAGRPSLARRAGMGRQTLAGASGWYGQADPRWRVGLVWAGSLRAVGGLGGGHPGVMNKWPNPEPVLCRKAQRQHQPQPL